MSSSRETCAISSFVTLMFICSERPRARTYTYNEPCATSMRMMFEVEQAYGWWSLRAVRFHTQSTHINTLYPCRYTDLKSAHSAFRLTLSCVLFTVSSWNSLLLLFLCFMSILTLLILLSRKIHSPLPWLFPRVRAISFCFYFFVVEISAQLPKSLCREGLALSMWRVEMLYFYSSVVESWECVCVAKGRQKDCTWRPWCRADILIDVDRLSLFPRPFHAHSCRCDTTAAVYVHSYMLVITTATLPACLSSS